MVHSLELLGVSHIDWRYDEAQALIGSTAYRERTLDNRLLKDGLRKTWAAWLPSVRQPPTLNRPMMSASSVPAGSWGSPAVPSGGRQANRTRRR